MGPLVKRVLTAMVAIPVVLFLTFWDVTLPFKLIVIAGLVVGLLEYLQLAYDDQIKPQRSEGIISLVIILLPYIDPSTFHWSPAASILVVLFLLNLSFLWSQRTIKRMIVTVSVTFFGLAYFGFFGSYFYRLRELPNGAWMLLWLFIATWAYDTGGYFVGGRWGKHKLAPLSRPKRAGKVVLAGRFFRSLV